MTDLDPERPVLTHMGSLKTQYVTARDCEDIGISYMS